MVSAINFLKHLDKYYQINQTEYDYNKTIFIGIPFFLSILVYLLFSLETIQDLFRELITFFAILISLSISILIYIININNLNFLGEDKKAERTKSKIIKFKEKFALGLFSLIIWGTLLVFTFALYTTFDLTELKPFKECIISILSIILLFLLFHISIIILNIYRLLAHLMEANFNLEIKKNGKGK